MHLGPWIKHKMAFWAVLKVNLAPSKLEQGIILGVPLPACGFPSYYAFAMSFGRTIIIFNIWAGR